MIVAAPNHPLVGQRNVSLSALSDEAFVARERGSDTWNSMQEGFAGRLSNMRIAMEIKSTETIKQAVIANMGIALPIGPYRGPGTADRQACRARYRRLPGHAQLVCSAPQEQASSPVALAFKQFLMEEGAGLIQRITGVEGR
ncbi:LysR substrate-binding domain-containing protein [Cupriavidus basilensis]